MHDNAQTNRRRGRKRVDIMIDVDGERVTLRSLARSRGFAYGTIKSRIERGWPIEQAIAEPTSTQSRARRAVPSPRVDVEPMPSVVRLADGCATCVELAAKVERLRSEIERIHASLRFEAGDVWRIGSGCVVITETIGDGRAGVTLGSKCWTSPIAMRLVMRDGKPWRWPLP